MSLLDPSARHLAQNLRKWTLAPKHLAEGQLYKVQGKHQMRKGYSDTYTDRDDLADKRTTRRRENHGMRKADSDKYTDRADLAQ